ncbi:MAG: hypothetical protein PWQ20_45 [Thermotogaceae bacterium]|jgi:hypothetical protein|nr:hypothetical protein [Thermotogaceae bacterium]MDN5336975.1 hypothetical protein [Thermotogaceae bacterium]
MSNRKYYSRSPEEWKKLDEEKRRIYLQRNQRLRRRAYTFLFINFFVIAIVLLGYFISKEFPAPQQPYVSFSGDLSFQLIMGKNEKYHPDELVDVVVKAINNSKKSVKLKIKNFKITILDRSNNAVYDFVYTETVEKELEGYQSVLIFSLKHEKELRLPPGIYRIDTEIELDKDNIRLQRTFEVEESVSISLTSKDDFLFPEEESQISVYFTNHSLYSGTLSLSSLNFSINNSGFRVPVEKREFSISSGEELKITDIKFQAPKEKGIYLTKVEAVFLLDREIKTFSAEKSIVVIPKEELSNTDNLRIITDSVIVATKGNEIKFKVFFANDSSKDKFIILNRFLLRISKSGMDFYKYDTVQNFKIMVPAYSKRIIFNTEDWQRLIFNEEGKYDVEITAHTNTGTIKHHYQILVY